MKVHSFSLNSASFEFNFLCFFFFDLGTILEQLWSEECQNFGHDVTKLFARFIV